MRSLIAVVLIVALLALVGWVTFSTAPGRTSVNVETDKIERDLEDLSESAREAGREIRENVTQRETSASPE